MRAKKKWVKSIMAFMLICSMILPSTALTVRANPGTYAARSIDVTEYGADPTGVRDSTQAIWDALQAARELGEEGEPVTLNFPTGEYHIYKDQAQVREYHTSNTNSIESPEKTIGILIEG